MDDYVPIKSYFKCEPYSGAEILCPKCNKTSTIYHLSWSALGCIHCNAFINKYDWKIKKGKYSKQ